MPLLLPKKEKEKKTWLGSTSFRRPVEGGPVVQWLTRLTTDHRRLMGELTLSTISLLQYYMFLSPQNEPFGHLCE